MGRRMQLGLVGALVVVSSLLVANVAIGARSSNPPKTKADPSQPQNVPSGGHQASFVPLTPCRILDTRKAVGTFANNETRQAYVNGTFGFAPQGGTSGGCSIPSWATAVSMTITAISGGSGYVRAWPAGKAEPTATVLSYAKGSVGTGTIATVSPGTAKNLSIKNYGSPTDLVIDVTGYYQPAIYAVVSSNGTLLYSSRLTVSSHTSSSGSYTLTGDTSLTSCSINAAGWGSYSAAAYGSGTSIYVNTWNNANQVADAYFQVDVTC